MAVYTFSPNAPNPSKVNQMLGSSKITEIKTSFVFTSPIVLITSSALSNAELDAIRAKLDKIFIFGYTETVE